MPTRTQTLRSSVKGTRPAVGSREVGELFINFADRQIGMVDATKTPVDLVGVRFFAITSDYAVGDFAVQGGQLYRANAAITAGAFNVANWDLVPAAPADLLTTIKTVDGAGSGLDADLLDGQSSAYFTTLANQTGTISDAQHGSRAGGALHAAATAAVAGFMIDAPSDGNTYARRNAAWLATAVFVDAPNDASAYVRSGLAWVVGYTKAAIDTLLAAKIGDAPNDANAYVRSGLAWVVGYTKAALDTLLGLKAPLASPTFTGTVNSAAIKVNGNSVVTRVIQSVYTSNFTYAKATNNPVAVEVTVIGSGGGSPSVVSTAASQSAASGGGAGAGAAIKLYDAAALAASITCTVAAAAAASAGGSTTTFGHTTPLSATGGGVGAASTASAGTAASTGISAPGVGSGGDLNLSGERGGTGWRAVMGTAQWGMGGDGGAAPLYGARTVGVLTGTTVAVTAGQFPGGGATGAGLGQSQSSAVGAGSGGGCIIIREFCTG